MKRSATHAAALEYAERGWHVFPVEPVRIGDAESGKKPLVQLVPNGKDDATTDPRQIDSWWYRFPDAGVAIALEPSKMMVLDVDIGEYKDKDGVVRQKKGAESLAAIDHELTKTLTARTGSGGLHAFYQTDGQGPIQKIGFRDGLDLIGKGYVVAAPSRHWTGNHYTWSDIVTPAVLPRFLRVVATKPKQEKIVVVDDTDRAPLAQGGRNTALFRLGAALRDSGIGANALASALHWENQQRCQPPLEDAELKQIIDSVLRRIIPSRDVAAGAIVAEEIRQLVTPKHIGPAWIQEVAMREEPPMRAYETGFPELDKMLGGGVWSRQVCGIIGSPSSGKSAFVGSLAIELQKQLPVLHCSTELPSFEIFVRYASLQKGWPWREGIRGKYGAQDLKNAVEGLRVKILGSDNLDRVDPIGMLQREAALIREQTGIAPAIIVDYVQMLARGSADQIRSKVGELTMSLRILSQTMDVPVVAVFSSRRDFYGGTKIDMMREADDPTSYLVAAKESGDIEFDCATLLYLDVDKLHQGQPKPARVVVARCRVGDIGFAGARAQLDVGKWWGDQAAAEEIKPSKRPVRTDDHALDFICTRVLEVIRKFPGRPWKEYAEMSGAKNKAGLAKAKLLELGKLRVPKVAGYDIHGRRIYREMVELVEDPPSPQQVSEPVEPEEEDEES